MEKKIKIIKERIQEEINRNPPDVRGKYLPVRNPETAGLYRALKIIEEECESERVNVETDGMHPLPWKHETNGKDMTAVVDADGKIVAGSLICQVTWNPQKEIHTHKFIVQCANRHK